MALYTLQGRGFTLPNLKAAIIAACGGKLDSFYLDCWTLPVDELVEALEIVKELTPDHGR